MTVPEFERIVTLVRRWTGVSIPHAKKGIVEGQVQDLIRAHGFASCRALLEAVDAGDPAVQSALIDALMTNETLFFRDRQPFEEFSTLMLPQLHAVRAREVPIRIWSAASASGQEAYSLAMLVHESRHLIGTRRVEIFASDISKTMITKARAGKYSSFEVQRGLSAARLIRHFEQVGLQWKIKPEIAGMVRFEQVNLTEDFNRLPHFDIIFCRNVMMYFENETRRRLIGQLACHLRPDGFLVLGGAESILHLSGLFQPYSPTHVSCVRTPMARKRALSA